VRQCLTRQTRVRIGSRRWASVSHPCSSAASRTSAAACIVRALPEFPRRFPGRAV